jgi:hypothetical protein
MIGVDFDAIGQPLKNILLSPETGEIWESTSVIYRL